jgi:uncharacterized repeat protein (TIGR03803 family)
MTGELQTRRAPARQRAPRFRPRLETLEARVTPSSGLSTLALFNGANGAEPFAGLIADSSGNLYGTTASGGANGSGTIFEIARGSSTVTTLASFPASQGTNNGLVMDGSGNLYGTTWYGVFELARGSNTITNLASFNGTNGDGPNDGLVMDSSGNLYGTTYEGGATLNLQADNPGDGTIFELAKGKNSITTLVSFTGSNGTHPLAGLIMDSSGNLYGTTTAGGANNGGTIFKLAKGRTITTLASFPSVSPGYAAGPSSLIMDTSGNLYGTDTVGGVNNTGTIFKLAKGSSTITTLASFPSVSPGYAAGPSAVIMDQSGNLYGTTAGAGANNDGSVFELTKESSTITTLASFNGSNGRDPSAVFVDSSGDLYGTTYGGGAPNTDLGDGAVFELLPHTPEISWSTPSPITYGTALSSTQLDASAVDSVTGATVAGTFVYTPASGTIVHGGIQPLTVTFTPADTTDYSPITTRVALVVNLATPLITWNTPAPISYGTPLSSVQLDASATDPITGSPMSGTFAYLPGSGTILNPGSTAMNVTFTPTDTIDYTTASASVAQVVTPGYSVSTLATFNSTNGTAPEGGLIMDSSGNLYGVTRAAGTNGDGTLFEIAQGSNTITTLASFNGSNGRYPSAGLFMDSIGNLYGTTSSGGASGYGTVFELARGSNTITALTSFNGTGTSAGVILDPSGNLYGTTADGGVYNDGTIFELAKGSSTITTLASFDGSNGADPETGLVMDPSGNLYGTTVDGGVFNSNDGTIFELAKGSSTITTLASFNGSNGANPNTVLVMDQSGNLYGVTNAGGAHGDGSVFELAKGSRSIMVLASFNGLVGSLSGLILDSSGNLYGTTYYGGSAGLGTVFEVGAGNGAITTLASFVGANGEYANGGLTLDKRGNLYGTTSSSSSGDGTIFELPAAAAAHPAFQISGFPATTSAGTAQTFTVTVQNADGTTDTGYTGTIHFTSTDPQAVLPADYTFTSADAGVHTFTVTLKTAGTQAIIATDSANSFIAGSATSTVTPAAASRLVITGPSTVTAGGAFSITVTAYDAFGNVATGYTGAVQFTSSDTTANLPANYTFQASDNGTHTFSGLVLNKKGKQSITAADTLSSGIMGSLSVDVT